MTSLRQAVESLYRIAITEGSTTSPNRLAVLAQLCIEQLHLRGLPDAAAELVVPGIGRSKRWDVGWPGTGKVRLGISLKSLLSNTPGTVPNRVDDLAGEMANVQLLSPEIVTGYIMIFHSGEGTATRRDGTPWVDIFRDAVERLSGRDAPAWAPGMMEASAVVVVDFTDGPNIVHKPDLQAFFNRLSACVRERNADMF